MALEGSATLRVVLSREDIDHLTRAFEQAVQAESSRLATHLGDTAVRMLEELERGEGHQTLAGLWDHTEPVEMADGVEVEVFSHAEDETFHSMHFDSSGNRIRDDAYPVPGSKLIAWLEYGVAEHDIVPRDTSHPLHIPIMEGWKASDFVGTAITAKGVEQGRFVGPTPDQVLRTDLVQHPGFAGDHNLAAVKLLIEAELAEFGEEAANRVSIDLA